MLTKVIKYQSIPAARIPPPWAITGYLPTLSVLGVGH